MEGSGEYLLYKFYGYSSTYEEYFLYLLHIWFCLLVLDVQWAFSGWTFVDLMVSLSLCEGNRILKVLVPEYFNFQVGNEFPAYI